jgi:hypothetical protein
MITHDLVLIIKTISKSIIGTSNFETSKSMSPSETSKSGHHCAMCEEEPDTLLKIAIGIMILTLILTMGSFAVGSTYGYESYLPILLYVPGRIVMFSGILWIMLLILAAVVMIIGTSTICINMLIYFTLKEGVPYILSVIKRSCTSNNGHTSKSNSKSSKSAESSTAGNSNGSIYNTAIQWLIPQTP